MDSTATNLSSWEHFSNLNPVWYGLIVSILILLVGILNYYSSHIKPWYTKWKEERKRKKQPSIQLSQSDKTILKKLFTQVLDLNLAQQTLEVKLTWYGYDEDELHNIGEFIDETLKIENRISNEEIRTKINELAKAMDLFLDAFFKQSVARKSGYRGGYDYAGKVIKQDTQEEYDAQLELSTSIDNVGKQAYQKLLELIDQLKQLDII